MTRRTANASALGYAAFGVTLWMVSMIQAGWFYPSEHTLDFALAVTLGGSTMTIAGILQFFRGHTLDMLLFVAFAAFWWTWALNAHTLLGGAPLPTAGFLGWYYFLWCFLAFCAWIAAFKGGVARMLFTLGLWLSLLSRALAGWTRIEILVVLGGYLGLITAVVGIYLAGAEVINDSYGTSVLPTGEAPRDDD
jgi:uncharacterized protein